MSSMCCAMFCVGTELTATSSNVELDDGGECADASTIASECDIGKLWTLSSTLPPSVERRSIVFSLENPILMHLHTLTHVHLHQQPFASFSLHG